MLITYKPYIYIYIYMYTHTKGLSPVECQLAVGLNKVMNVRKDDGSFVPVLCLDHDSLVQSVGRILGSLFPGSLFSSQGRRQHAVRLPPAHHHVHADGRVQEAQHAHREPHRALPLGPHRGLGGWHLPLRPDQRRAERHHPNNANDNNNDNNNNNNNHTHTINN